jgi:simple sugar transport system permease protein/ribose transport system permease protein
MKRAGLIEARGLSRVPALRNPSAISVVIAVLAVLLAVAALTTSGFWSTANIRSVLFSGALVGIIACGLTLITLSGSILSMSLGITAAVSAIWFISALDLGLPVAILTTLFLGAGICAAQGVLVGFWGANPIIVTIGAGVVQSGVVQWLTNGASQQPPAGVDYDFLTDVVFGIPVAFYILIAVAVSIELMLRRTVLGRTMFLVGANKAAARAAALGVSTATVAAFAIAGACAACTGVLLGATNQSADLNLEADLTFDSIAAVLVVGTVITGGHGSAIRSAFGAMGIAVIISVLVLRGFNPGVRLIVEGVIVLAVVTAAHVARQRTAMR